MQYVLHFTGRKIGAIGVTYPVTLTVEVDNEAEARWAAYKTHENITGGINRIRVTRLLPRKSYPCRTS